jgi:hypothetical protein
MRASSGNELLAALGATACQHAAATRGFHAGAKAVGALPAQLLGLISTFAHGFSPVLLKRARILAASPLPSKEIRSKGAVAACG